MRIRYIYILVLLVALLTACREDWKNGISAEQVELIGRAVNFNASYADEFVTRASTYTDNINGNFNQNDLMRIYRNYYENGQWSPNEAYRTYRYIYKADQTSGIDLGHDWQPEKGRQGYDDWNGDSTYTAKTQLASDSLTWENGKTVRFRAWSLSNYHNVLNGASKTYFYPDYSIASYVNTSGPTTSIPMVLKHQGTRFVFQPLQSGNDFYRIEICAAVNPDGTPHADAWRDYKYADNADTHDNDNASTEAGKSDEQAQLECDSVTAVYLRMCMPAGVDIASGTLKAVLNTRWNNYSDTLVRYLEDQPEADFITYGTRSAGDIATLAKRPFFSIINTYPIMITIPYDISNTTDMPGEVLTLPACTRFRVYMRDVNKGDGFNTGTYEGKYHILALSDVKLPDGVTPAFPGGLKLGPGKSFTFKVGYRYGGLYVVVDNSLQWTNLDMDDSAILNNQIEQPISTASDYQWWKKAIHEAIPKGTEAFRPVFEISNEKEFLEFINLVNGTAADSTSGLYLLDSTYVEGGQIKSKKKWSKVNSVYKPQWVEEADMEKLGYIFYDHYHAANADKAAYSERDYLKGPYPFYDDNLRRNFTILLKNDLDLSDWALPTIGPSAATAFRGCLDGQGHTISNLYMENETMFGYVNGDGTEHAAICNLQIESVHPVCLVGTGVNAIYIAGISILAPSTTHSIAHSLTSDILSGTSYVVGCIHVGDAGGALVGTASNLNMFGCMQAAEGLTYASGALIGVDANVPAVFVPQISLAGQKAGVNVKSKPSFRNFIGNYYDKELSPATCAVGGTSDDYSLLEYIRGSRTDILRAKNDYLTTNVTMAQLLKQSNYTNYYGLAPWKVMNYSIYWYNKNRVTSQINHPCSVHYENNTTGYSHRYPVWTDASPESRYGESVVSGWNPVEQSN